MPVAYLFATMIVMAGLDVWIPMATLEFAYIDTVGWLLVLLGLAIVILAGMQFRRAGTTIRPFGKSSALVTSGLFSMSRNPIYVAMVVSLAGIALLAGSLSAWLPIPLFIWLIQQNVIRDEETMLLDVFGDEYRAYQQRVRRWI